MLWQCNPISDEDRLKRAKKDFLERGYTDEDADIIRDYDIDLETLQEWRHNEPERPLSHRMFGANPTINAGALQYLRKNFPDKVDAYETISKGIDLYIQAYHDALEHVVDQWFLLCGKEYVQKKFLELNGLFQNQTSPEKIRSEFLPDIKASHKTQLTWKKIDYRMRSIIRLYRYPYFSNIFRWNLLSFINKSHTVSCPCDCNIKLRKAFSLHIFGFFR